MLTDIIITSLLSAFIILLITKLGLRDFIIESGPAIISKMFNCDFCLSFWTNMIIAMVLTSLTGQINLLVLPIFTAPITRILI